jgi:hypothetical protein
VCAGHGRQPRHDYAPLGTEAGVRTVLRTAPAVDDTQSSAPTPTRACFFEGATVSAHQIGCAKLRVSPKEAGPAHDGSRVRFSSSGPRVARRYRGFCPSDSRTPRGPWPNPWPKEPRPDLTPGRRRLRWHRVSQWRDPDSNRGHHDFQSCGLGRGEAANHWKSMGLHKTDGYLTFPQFPGLSGNRRSARGT